MIKALWMTMKPQSFLISAVSAGVGASLAALHATFDWPAFLLTVLGCILLHGGANVLNDYFDSRYGVDTDQVPGSYGNEARVLIRGLMQPRQVLAVGLALYALAVPVGLYLIALRGWTILVLGLVGFATGVCYTARPVALKYKALGEIAVFFMFGPLMVSGAYFVQAGAFRPHVLWVSVPFGIFVALVLLANNIRDEGFDGQVGIRTVATVLGGSRAALVYQGFVLFAYALNCLMVALGILGPFALLTLLSLPIAWRLMGMFRRGVPADADARTAQLHTLFGILLILGIQLQRFCP
ncbi:MAG: prenyltransferase [Deltaproteobacteria bacterium]|nr:prenyltransferase [Deltaproteobacteria bacterium]